MIQNDSVLDPLGLGIDHWVRGQYVNLNLRRVATGWRRPIGCLKLKVIFRKRATNYRALLRKMSYIDKASYFSTLSCTARSRKDETPSCRRNENGNGNGNGNPRWSSQVSFTMAH